MCALMLNATFYTWLQQSLGSGVHAKESLNCHVSFMPYIDINPAEFWGRFATKGGGWFPPLGCEHLSPESHHIVLQH